MDNPEEEEEGEEKARNFPMIQHKIENKQIHKFKHEKAIKTTVYFSHIDKQVVDSKICGIIELLRNDVGCLLRIENKTEFRVLQIAGHVDAAKRDLVTISSSLRGSLLRDHNNFQGGQGRVHSPDQRSFADDEVSPYMNNNARVLDGSPFSQQSSPDLYNSRDDHYAQRSSVCALDSKVNAMGNHAHPCPGQDVVLFRIFCPTEKVDRVMGEIDGIMELIRNDVAVAKANVGCFLGKGRKVIEQMRIETKTQIRVLPRDHTLPQCVAMSEVVLQIAGHVDAVKRALVIVSLHLRESQLGDRSHFQGVQGQAHSPDPHFFADDETFPYMNNNARTLDEPPFSQQHSPALSYLRNDIYAQRSSVNTLDSKSSTMGNHAHLFSVQGAVFSIFCPIEKVGIVSVESDGVIELLRNEFGVNIWIVDPEPGSDERIIMKYLDEIAGHVDAAKRDLVTISSSLRGSLLCDHSHFQGGQGREYSSDQRFFADDGLSPYTNNNARALDGPPFRQQPSSALSNFRNDNYAQRSSVCEIDSKFNAMGNHEHPFPGQDVVFRILCPTEKVDRVMGERDGIMELIRNDVSVAKTNVGCFFGKGRKVIEQMRIETKTQIRVLPRDHTVPQRVTMSEVVLQVPNSFIHGTTVIIFLNKNIIKVFIDGRQVYESVFITRETTKKFTVIRKKVIVCYAGDVKEGIAVLDHLKTLSAAKKFVVSADAVKDFLLSTYQPQYDQETDVIICGFRPSGDPYIHHVLIQKTKPRLKLMPSKNNKFRVFGSGGDKVRMHFNDVDDSYKDVDEQIEVGVAMASVRDANTGGYFFKIEMHFDLKEIISKPVKERSVVYLRKHFDAWKNQNYVFLLYDREEQPVSYFERWIKSKFYNGKFPAKPKIIFELTPIGRAIPSRLAFGVGKLLGPMLVNKVCSQGNKVLNRRKLRTFTGLDIREYLYEAKTIYAVKPSQEFLDQIEIQGYDEYRKAEKLSKELEKSGKK